jgi:hypothetical protein
VLSPSASIQSGYKKSGYGAENFILGSNTVENIHEQETINTTCGISTENKCVCLIIFVMN